MSEADQIRIFKTRQLLSLPLLLDVCAVYGPSNLELVQKLMQQALHLLPDLSQVCASSTSVLGRVLI